VRPRRRSRGSAQHFPATLPPVLLRRVGADLGAKYVGYQCAGGYHGGTDMPTALHPQNIMAVTFAVATLPVKCGYSFLLQIATKLGFKNAKWVTTIWFSGW
jgi:DMSO/TMAO reductase YedYZ molybdopterin-dependent catalytic subunit